MKEPLISVIIPIYKVEAYLDRCVESIVNQTYKNLEIILVDDGSPDNCPQMCDNWAEKDSRIKVVHKENGGLSDARNAGMKIASGDYFSFIDSDDFIDLCFYTNLLSLIIKYNADIAVCGFVHFSDYSDIQNNSQITNINEFDTVEALKEVINYGKIKQVVWNKLYKRSIIGDCFFDCGRIHEDTFWAYKIFGNAKKTVLTDYIGYYYYQRDDSITGSCNSKSIKDSIDARLFRLGYLKEYYPQLLDFAKFEFLCSCLSSGQEVIRSNENTKKDTFLYIKKGIKKADLSLASIYRVSKKYVVWYTLSKISIKATCRIRNMFGIGF